MWRAVLWAVLMLALPIAAFANNSLAFTNTGRSVQLKGGTLLGSTLFTGFILGSGARRGTASGETVQFTFDVPGHVPFSSTVRGNSGITTASTVPGPGTLGLLGTGLVGIACLVRRRFRRLQLPSTSVRKPQDALLRPHEKVGLY